MGCLIIFGLLLNKTTFGRNTLAIGGNEEAARLAGVPVVRTKIIIFVIPVWFCCGGDYPGIANDQRSAHDLDWL
nr:L-arabinose transporter permease protein [Raoultella sp. NCTC 9187]